ncbi:MAG: uracil-DNA glycosylase [Zoogloeaceae bacterium]|nr:uracil-DNA glycosylase [Zoogloeaceae bacterium]
MSLTRERLLEEIGIKPLWKLRKPAGADAAELPAAEASAGAAAAAAAAQPLSTPAEAAGPVSEMGWPQLRDAVGACQRCGLCAERKQAVLGVGDEQADWLFIGEGPGAEEDARGEPFVGPAGQLLDAMLAAIDLQRGNNVYIANAVKCRPPGNRTPEANEIDVCRPWLQRQIALLRPKLIVLLGKVAMHAVLNEDSALGASRGKRFEYRDGDLVVPVIVTYHPAYLLRNLPDKAKAWEDLCLARRLMREQQAGSRLPVGAH